MSLNRKPGDIYYYVETIGNKAVIHIARNTKLINWRHRNGLKKCYSKTQALIYLEGLNVSNYTVNLIST